MSTTPKCSGGMFRLGFNVLKDGPWQDAHVRQAISLWIDREAAIPTVLGGFGYISPHVQPCQPLYVYGLHDVAAIQSGRGWGSGERRRAT